MRLLNRGLLRAVLAAVVLATRRAGHRLGSRADWRDGRQDQQIVLTAARTYAHGPGGLRLGTAPVSVPLGVERSRASAQVQTP